MAYACLIRCDERRTLGRQPREQSRVIWFEKLRIGELKRRLILKILPCPYIHTLTHTHTYTHTHTHTHTQQEDISDEEESALGDDEEYEDDDGDSDEEEEEVAEDGVCKKGKEAGGTWFTGYT